MLVDAIYINIFISVAILILVYLLDRWEKEPPFFVSEVYLISIFTTYLFGKFKFGFLVSPDTQLDPAVDAFILAGLLEESVKFAIFMLFVWRNKNFNEKMDGIVYYMIIAAGFAVIENINYTLHYTQFPYIFGIVTGQQNEYYRSLLYIVAVRSLPGHLMFGVISGFFIGRAKFKGKGNKFQIFTGFFSAILLHGLWNLLAGISWAVFLIYFIGLGALCIFITTKTLQISKYRIAVAELESKVRRSIENAKNTYGYSVTSSLRKIRKQLRYLHKLEGPEMEDTLSWIIERFPEPFDAFPEKGLGGITERLGEISDELHKFKNRVDWSFVALLSIVLVVPSSFLIGILIIIG